MAKKKFSNRNGYPTVYTGDSLETAEFKDYQYEHLLVAEEMLGRRLKEGEDVHHLDSNRSNNSPDNLLVLSSPMHAKLHRWLDKNIIIPKPEYAERKELGCIRCATCEKPIEYGMKYCSVNCSAEGSEHKHKYQHPDKESLEKLLWSKPTIEVAKELGVSDKAIEKLAKKLEVEKPPRGYWNKVNAGLICPLK